MTSVTDWMINTVKQMPDSFPEKVRALDFLRDDYSDPNTTLALARALLGEVATGCHSQKTWTFLIDTHLIAAEKAYQRLLPHHRDHVLHSAHLYLLGLCLYWTLIRPDAGLSACIANTQYLDAQAFYSPASRLYSCHPRLITTSDLDSERSKIFESIPTADPHLPYARSLWEAIPHLLPCDCDDNVAGAICTAEAYMKTLKSQYHCCPK